VPSRPRLVAAGLTVLLLVGGALLVVLGRREASGGTARDQALGRVKPSELNVILITVDTLRTDRLSAYGSRDVSTPQIDALAREGVLFTNAASTVPSTLPAHVSILTGTYPPDHGVRENVGYVLDGRAPTLATLLGTRGWATAAFVSAYVLDAQSGTGRGFDRYFDDFDLGRQKSVDISTVRRTGDKTVAEAVRWLDARPADRPFFLWLHLYDPHDPYRPPEPYRTAHPGRPYDGTVAFTDAVIGSFRHALEERGLLDRSLLVFTADHGEGLGDHGEMFHGYFVYDTTIHVPLIIRTPSRTLAGRVVTDAVSHVDLLPTVLEAASLEVPAIAHGISLLPLMSGTAHPTRSGVYSESFYPLTHYGWAPLRSLRSDTFKLIDVPRPELYDVVHDRGERHDLIGIEAAIGRTMRADLGRLEHKITRNTTESAAQVAPSMETLSRLRSLGYVAGTSRPDPSREGAASRVDPKDKVDVHQRIVAARDLIGRGKAEPAIASLNELLVSDPALLEAHEMLGALAGESGQFDLAANHFRSALAVDPDRQTSLLGLANAHHGMGRDDDAVKGFRRVLAESGGSSRAALALSQILLERDQVAEAAKVLEDAIKLDPAAALLLNALGEVQVQQGRRDEALSLFRRAIAADDRLASAYFRLGALHEERGDSSQAIAYYRQAIERAPNAFQAHFNLGRLYGEKGDVDAQQASWEAAVLANRDFASGYIYLGKLLMDRGDLPRAEKLTRTGLRKDPSHASGPLGYYVLADILNRSGRRPEAQRAVQEAESLDFATRRGGP
jgi:arylsulfatase A-like enzyme/tetratricopeptide (TPR) repeat protein